MLKDIRVEKERLRAQNRQLRERLSPEEKLQQDLRIAARLLSLPQYRSCDTLFVYVSKPPLEVDTSYLIQAGWAQGKFVAAPRCVPGTREMQFYLIERPQNLAPGSFGVREPVPERCPAAQATKRSLCVVPGISFDQAGYRLGYGKGYYDRFLAGFPGKTVGICYEENLLAVLPHGRFDRPVDWIITEKSAYAVPFGLSAQRG
ncbi:MAG: 5-formyltetrahydrofolate cyclo-ligase [Firmicutes bacterium]|nr:5-formyltetrahydrofolate cyclo-ligase [Bacillota bacterium]